MSEVATDPNSTRWVGDYGSPYAAGTIEGIDIEVVFFPQTIRDGPDRFRPLIRRMFHQIHGEVKMEPSDDEWDAVGERVLGLLHQHEDVLPARTKGWVEKYLTHNEYELALEGLLIDLIEGGLMIAEVFEECVELGEMLGLDEETVLRDDFWALLLEQGHVVE